MNCGRYVRQIRRCTLELVLAEVSDLGTEYDNRFRLYHSDIDLRCHIAVAVGYKYGRHLGTRIEICHTLKKKKSMVNRI